MSEQGELIPADKKPQEVAVREKAAVAPVADPSVAFFGLIEDVDKLKEIPMDTVRELFALNDRMRAENARREYNEAFLAVQKSLNPVIRRGWNTHTKSAYALLEDVIEMLEPKLFENGFSRSISTEECKTEEMTTFVLLLRHTGGHEERHRMDGPIDYLGSGGKANKTKLHGMASSFTYCERHLLCKVFGIQTTKDDDGNAGAGIHKGSGKITQQQANNIRDKILETKASEKRFVELYGVTKVEDIPQNMYQAALSALSLKGKSG